MKPERLNENKAMMGKIVKMFATGDLSDVDVERETIDIVRFANGQGVEHWGIRLWISESGERR